MKVWALEHDNAERGCPDGMVVLAEDEDGARLGAARKAGGGDLEKGAVWLAKPITRCVEVDLGKECVVLVSYVE